MWMSERGGVRKEKKTNKQKKKKKKKKKERKRKKRKETIKKGSSQLCRTLTNL